MTPICRFFPAATILIGFATFLAGALSMLLPPTPSDIGRTRTPVSIADSSQREPFGQSFAVLEMLVGQSFLVTLVAGLVSLCRPGRTKANGPA